MRWTNSSPGRKLSGFTTELAVVSGADVRVVHVRELSKLARVPPIERPADAQLLVDEAVLHLRTARIGAEGRAISAVKEQVARLIVQESAEWGCSPRSLRESTTGPVLTPKEDDSFGFHETFTGEEGVVQTSCQLTRERPSQQVRHGTTKSCRRCSRP